MSRRKIRTRTKIRRPRGNHARNADAQSRAAAAAFQRYAMKPKDRDRSALDEMPTKDEAGAHVEQVAEELDEMSAEFDQEKFDEMKKEEKQNG